MGFLHTATATDKIGNEKHQKVKVEFGEPGAATQVSEANPLPVRLSSGITSDTSDASTDAFGRLRVSEPITLFDSKQLYDKRTILWTEALSGGATSVHFPNLAATRLTCGTASGDKATRQTKFYIPYQPGKSLSVKVTGVMGNLKANVRQRIGYFDDNNGLFFEQDGTNLKVARRSYVSGSPVDTSVNQSNWNIDKMDGTGVSGITLDMSKTQIFVIDFQWLGVGRVRYGFNVDGKMYYVHEMLHANIENNVYMSKPTLPVRYQIENTAGTASSTYLDSICTSVVSEGGYSFNGVAFAVDRGITSRTVGTTLIPLVSIRLQSAYIRSTLSNFSVDVCNTGNSIYKWALFLNPTITGGNAASWVTVGNSYAEYDISATGTVSGGMLIHSGYGSGQGSVRGAVNQEVNTPMIVAADISGTSDILVLAAQVTTGTDAMFGGIGWKEYN